MPVKINTAGHSDLPAAIKAAESLFKSIAEHLQIQELQVTLMGAEKGGPHRRPLKIIGMAEPPQTWVEAIAQPLGNETCRRFRLIAGGMSAQELKEKIESLDIRRTKKSWTINVRKEKPSGLEFVVGQEAVKEAPAAAPPEKIKVKKGRIAAKGEEELIKIISSSEVGTTFTARYLIQYLMDRIEGITYAAGNYILHKLVKGGFIRRLRKGVYSVTDKDKEMGAPPVDLEEAPLEETEISLTSNQEGQLPTKLIGTVFQINVNASFEIPANPNFLRELADLLEKYS